MGPAGTFMINHFDLFGLRHVHLDRHGGNTIRYHRHLKPVISREGIRPEDGHVGEFGSRFITSAPRPRAGFRRGMPGPGADQLACGGDDVGGAGVAADTDPDSPCGLFWSQAERS